MSALGGALIRGIRVRAEATSHPALFATACFDPQSPPTPSPPPAIPADIITTVLNDGSIRIAWKPVNPRGHTGTSVIIFRKLASDNSYRQIGTSTQRTFNDENVPPGTPAIHYMLHAVRGKSQSEFSEPVTVYLGTAGTDGAEGLTLAA